MKYFFNVLIICFILSSCGSKTEEKTQAIKPVKYEIIGNNSSLTIKKFNGISKSGTEAKLSFRANGLIVSLNPKIGDKVKKGQLLAKLDQKDIEFGYQKAKTAVSSSKSQMETAKTNLERVKELYQINSAPLTDYEQAKNGYTNAQANYEAAIRSMNIQKSQFDYTQIIAPFSGIITDVNANINEFAQAGSPIFIMNSEGSDLEITVGVPEAYISYIKNGEEASVTISNEDVKGVISEVGFSSTGSLTYPVVIKLLNPSKKLRPGMPAEVSFNIQSATTDYENMLIAPVKAIGNDTEGDFVFVLKQQENNHYLVTKQHVVLGDLTDQGFIVNEGLNDSDIVATAGLRTLYDGMVVKLLNQKK